MARLLDRVEARCRAPEIALSDEDTALLVGNAAVQLQEMSVDEMDDAAAAMLRMPKGDLEAAIGALREAEEAEDAAAAAEAGFTAPRGRAGSVGI